jgi:hypothetical protein
MKRTLFLPVALLALCLPVIAVAADMYSWTDANGVKHFSDSPPPASIAKAQKLQMKGGMTLNAPVEDPADAAANSGGPALAAAAGYAPDDIKRNCETATKNLAQFEAQQVPLDADGYPLDLDAAKNRQSQIDKATQQTKLFCSE